MKKYFLTLVFLGIAVWGPAQVTTYFFSQADMAGFYFNAVSDNGRYVAGTSDTSGDTYLFDTATGEMLISSPIGGIVTDVSDEGVMVGKFADPEAVVIKKGEKIICEVPGIYRDGEWTALERYPGSELIGSGWDGTALCISPDGRYAAGCLMDSEKGFFYQPVIWENGKIAEVLPGASGGVGARILAISDDGRVAGGWNDDSMYGNVMIWKDGEVVLEDKMGRASVVSSAGHFVGGSYDDGAHVFGIPFIWSAEQGVTAIAYPEKTHSGGVTGISANGRIVMGYVNYKGLADHHPFIIYEGKYYDFDEWMADMYEVEGYAGISFFTATSLSADGRVMCGFSMYDGARCPWILVFDETLSVTAPEEEGATGVSVDASSERLEVKGEYESVAIYDPAGRCVLTDMAANGTVGISQLQGGMYVVKVKAGRKEHSYKVMVPGK